jgi:hypothetical protein
VITVTNNDVASATADFLIVCSLRIHCGGMFRRPER